MDMKYALTPGLTFTATVNPDFGQVEADPAVVNLSAFETFFNEQRPFFVEGSGNFRFDADCYDGCNNLFYSRRIGRAPQGLGIAAVGGRHLHGRADAVDDSRRGQADGTHRPLLDRRHACGDAGRIRGRVHAGREV